MATDNVATEEQVVVFELGNENYGVDIASVQEIIRIQKITKVPRAPAFVEGVTNLRGKVIPVIDLRKRFGLALLETTIESRIVVVEIGAQTVGMVVDGVSEVLRLSSTSIEPPSPVVTTIDSEFIRGIAKIGDRLVIVLDLEKVLSKDETKALVSVEKAAAKLAD